MLIKSKFNCTYHNGNQTIVFNSLSQIIVVLEADYSLDMFCNEDADLSIQQFLLDYHFLVHSEINEDSLARMYKFEDIMQDNLHVLIYPTTVCDFRCVYCYESIKPCSMDKSTLESLELFFKRQVKNYRSVYVEWFGGEPLMRKDIIFDLSENIIETCKRNGKQYIAAITTNGYQLNLETFKRLLDCHVYTYSITLDGPQDLHNKLRPHMNREDSFQIIINNLLEIKKQVSAKYFTILIRVNVTKELLDVFEEYLNFLNETFGDDSRFTFMFRIVEDYGGDRISRIRDNILDNTDIVYDYLLDSEVDLDFRGHYSLLSNRSCIAAKRNAYTIYTDGNIYKCTNIVENEENKIGHIGKHGEMILDKGILSQWIRTGENNEKCKECSFSPSCIDCPAKSYFMDNQRPCALSNDRLEKILTLLTKNVEGHTYGFVYKIGTRGITKC